ncbi:MAG: GerMN domain-containing protein [Spirochaetaceae bacterium]|nr:GerMN domain-containing protein [Spirochaetaceae bacterium]
MSNLISKRKKKNFFIILITFLILSSVELFIFIPRVNKAINESGMKEIIGQQNEKLIAKKKEQLTIFYIDIEGNPSSYLINSYSTYDKLHDTFEALKDPPSLDVLNHFYISYIPSNTKLIGATQTQNAIYINYSKEILQSKNINLCYKQIEATVKSFNNKAKLILLVNGVIYNI